MGHGHRSMCSAFCVVWALTYERAHFELLKPIPAGVPSSSSPESRPGLLSSRYLGPNRLASFSSPSPSTSLSLHHVHIHTHIYSWHHSLYVAFPFRKPVAHATPRGYAPFPPSTHTIQPVPPYAPSLSAVCCVDGSLLLAQRTQNCPTRYPTIHPHADIGHPAAGSCCCCVGARCPAE